MVGSNCNLHTLGELKKSSQPLDLVVFRPPKRLDACKPTSSGSLTQTKNRRKHQKKKTATLQTIWISPNWPYHLCHFDSKNTHHKKILSTRTPGFMNSSQAKVEWLAISLWLVNLPPYRPETRPY